MKMLVEYVRNKNNQPVGVVVAVGKNQIGWSEKHNKDKWDKYLGLEIAIGRAMNGSVKYPMKEKVFRPYINKMYDRADRYFK